MSGHGFGTPFPGAVSADSRMPQILDSNNTTDYTDDSVQYVGTWTQVRTVGIVRHLITVRSAVASGLGGTIIIEWSEDQINVTATRSFTIVNFSTLREFDLANLGGFMRVKFTPDRTVLVSENIYLTTRHLTQDSGPGVRLGASTTIASEVLALDFDQEVALGNVPGYSGNAKFGRVANIDAADAPVDIWAFADDGLTPRLAQKVFPSVAATLYVASSDNADTTQTVTVEYIDANGEAQTATGVALNGHTPVSLGVTGLDINRMFIDGSAEPAGKIYGAISNNFTAGVPNVTSDVLALIPIGYNQTQLTHFTVPLNKTLIMRELFLTASRASGADGSSQIDLEVTAFGGVPRIVREFFPTTAVALNDGIRGIVVGARSQIRWVVSSVSDADTNFSCVWGFHLVDS